MINHFNLDMNEIEKNEEFVKLKLEFEETNLKLLDPEYFHQILGEKINISMKPEHDTV